MVGTREGETIGNNEEEWSRDEVVVQQWNDLPKEIKNAKSVGSFKSQYTQWKLRQSEN